MKNFPKHILINTYNHKYIFNILCLCFSASMDMSSNYLDFDQTFSLYKYLQMD